MIKKSFENSRVSPEPKIKNFINHSRFFLINLHGNMITCRDLEKRTNEELLSMYHSETDGMKKQIGDLIVERNMELVRYISRKFDIRVELDNTTDREDVVQEGVIGLINARERYNPAIKVKFVTYATPTIFGTIYRHFRDKGRTKGVAHRRMGVFNRAKQKLEEKLKREPSRRELSEELGLSEEEVMYIERALAIQHAVPLNNKEYVDNGEGGEGISQDMIPYESDQYVIVDLKLLLRDVLDTLDEKSRKALELYYLKGLSQKEIGNLLGYSQAHVARLICKAKSRLKEEGLEKVI